MTFYLTNEHNFTITELENMIVFEKDLYVQLLMERLKEKEKNK